MADDALLELIKQHVEDDRRALDSVTAKLDKIDTNVTSLLMSREQTRGIGKVIAAAAGSGGLISLIFEMVKRYTH